MNQYIFFITFGTFLATLLGGLFALRFKDRLHLILGFSAGAVIGVAFFDLIPEAIELAAKTYDVSSILSVTAIGFLSYMILDRYFFFHKHNDGHHEKESIDRSRGILGASSLSAHSFLDGLAIGLAFKVSISVGVIVAIAVLVHDFSDGLNTVNLILKNQGQKKDAIKWLIIDALAPVLGLSSSFFITLSESSLGLLLAVFSGFFLYIGASDLLPESHHNHPTKLTTALTLLGAFAIYLAINLAGA